MHLAGVRLEVTIYSGSASNSDLGGGGVCALLNVILVFLDPPFRLAAICFVVLVMRKGGESS